MAKCRNDDTGRRVQMRAILRRSPLHVPACLVIAVLVAGSESLCRDSAVAQSPRARREPQVIKEDKEPARLVERQALDRSVYASLKDVINRGADSFNSGDPAACHHIYQRPLMDGPTVP